LYFIQKLTVAGFTPDLVPVKESACRCNQWWKFCCSRFKGFDFV